ncbi:hypothetical protein SAMN04489761_1989 [Tenacibaculum sp. MAR_2009_124]|nr:hypothetical protein SAMN04489761_1989 [Tenacibaculum sp. MAR_2009_124]
MHYLKNSFKSIVEFTLKYTAEIYIFLLVFFMLFFLLLMSASGHGFHFNLNTKIGYISAITAIISVLVNKKNINVRIIRVINNIFLLLSLIVTLTLACIAFYHNLNFKYGDDVSLLIIFLFFLIPLLFITINFILLKRVLQNRLP